MTREDILKQYEVKNGRIATSGKFENEPIFAPYFYEEWLNGGGNDHDTDDTSTVFYIELADLEEFPELEGCDRVYLDECDQGFVYCWSIASKNDRD